MSLFDRIGGLKSLRMDRCKGDCAELVLNRLLRTNLRSLQELEMTDLHSRALPDLFDKATHCIRFGPIADHLG